jgi:hypothetical protein
MVGWPCYFVPVARQDVMIEAHKAAHPMVDRKQ